MTTYLSDAGYTAPRAAQILDEIRNEFEVRLAARGLSTDIDWDRDVVLGILTAVIADRIGSVAELTQVLFDARDIGNATGLFLDNLGVIVGVPRQEATYSTVTLTCTGTNGTVIGALSAIARDIDGFLWIAQEDGTISGGTVDVVFRSETIGEIPASPGIITEIVTPISGWDTVTNAASATPGDDRELDSAYRVRIQQSLQGGGGGTVGSLFADLSALDYLAAVVVVDNPSGVAVVTGGVSLDPYAVAIILYPSTISAAQKVEVAQIIFGDVAMSTPMMGSDEVYNVTKADGATKTIYWDWATTTSVDTIVTVTLDTGYVLGDVQTAIEEAVTALFAGLSVGDDLQDLDILQVVDVEGVKRATITVNDGSGPVSGLTPNLNVLYVEGTTTVTT